MILSITLLILAAFFKAVADTLQHHYDISVFNKLDGRWWNPEVSWKNKYTSSNGYKRKKFYTVKIKIPTIKWKKSGKM